MDLYIGIVGNNVKIEIGNITLMYLAPANIVKFDKINQVSSGCMYIDTVFKDGCKQYIEEDYVDVGSILNEFNYDTVKILSSIDRYIIKGKKYVKYKETNDEMYLYGVKNCRKEEKKMTKMELIDKSLLVSDGIAFVFTSGSAGDWRVTAINVNRMKSIAIIRIEDSVVISSNMSDNMLKRTKEAFERNRELIIEEIREKIVHA